MGLDINSVFKYACGISHLTSCWEFFSFFCEVDLFERHLFNASSNKNWSEYPEKQLSLEVICAQFDHRSIFERSGRTQRLPGCIKEPSSMYHHRVPTPSILPKRQQACSQIIACR